MERSSKALLMARSLNPGLRSAARKPLAAASQSPSLAAEEARRTFSPSPFRPTRRGSREPLPRAQPHPRLRSSASTPPRVPYPVHPARCSTSAPRGQALAHTDRFAEHRMKIERNLALDKEDDGRAKVESSQLIAFFEVDRCIPEIFPNLFGAAIGDEIVEGETHPAHAGGPHRDSRHKHMCLGLLDDGDALIFRKELRDVLRADRIDRIERAAEIFDRDHLPAYGCMNAVVVARREVDGGVAPRGKTRRKRIAAEQLIHG